MTTAHREQCDFRFRFKNRPQCNAENDIAARRCRECDTILVDPDDIAEGGAEAEGRAGAALAAALACSTVATRKVRG